MDGKVIDIVEDQQRWFGHVKRMDARLWPSMLLHGRMHGTRPRGRPRTKWWTQFRTANSHICHWQLDETLRLLASSIGTISVDVALHWKSAYLNQKSSPEVRAEETL